MTTIKTVAIMMITKIAMNNKKITANKEKILKIKRLFRKSLSSKRTSPINVQMLKILVIKLRDSFFNIAQMIP